MASATKRARPIRALAPQVPPSVAAVIDRALELEMNDRWQSAQQMQDALRRARQAEDSSRTLANDSATFAMPLTPKSPEIPRLSDDEPTSSDRTQQIEPTKMIDRSKRTEPMRRSAPNGLEPIESGPIFGETTLAMDGPSYQREPVSKLPVSPIPSTERMSPGALPNAPPIAFAGTVPSFTPSSVRAVQPSYAPPPPLAPPPPPPNVAPTLRSSARGVLVFVVVFLVSVTLLLGLAWRFLF
jgi:serine/threonine protein kinase